MLDIFVYDDWCDVFFNEEFVFSQHQEPTLTRLLTLVRHHDINLGKIKVVHRYLLEVFEPDASLSLDMSSKEAYLDSALKIADLTSRETYT